MKTIEMVVNLYYIPRGLGLGGYVVRVRVRVRV